MGSSLRATCYDTPSMAIDAATTAGSFSTVSESSGYRVSKIQFDPVLGQRWAMIASCGHPEWPGLALPLKEPASLMTSQGPEWVSSNITKAGPMVRVGDTIQLWKQEDYLRIEVAGVSEESGDLGQTIRVRLLHGNNDGQSIPEHFLGVVRGPSNVEIRP